MEKVKNSFVFLFLTGMVFTMLSFIPCSQEESITQKMEMNEKSSEDCENTGGSGGGTDEDNNDDSKPFTAYICDQDINFLKNSGTHFQHYFRLYQIHAGSINTPPPESRHS